MAGVALSARVCACVNAWVLMYLSCLDVVFTRVRVPQLGSKEDVDELKDEVESECTQFGELKRVAVAGATVSCRSGVPASCVSRCFLACILTLPAVDAFFSCDTRNEWIAVPAVAGRLGKRARTFVRCSWSTPRQRRHSTCSCLFALPLALLCGALPVLSCPPSWWVCLVVCLLLVACCVFCSRRFRTEY